MTDAVPATRLGPLLARNRAFAGAGGHAGLTMMPRQPVFVVTCLDPRVDPAAFLGIELGDAAVIRNAGGRITDETVDAIAFIGFMAGMARPEGPLFEVAVVHHTNCGTGLLADAGVRAGYAARIGADEADLVATAVVDPEATVRADVERLRSAPKAPPRITVSGHVYDVETGLVTTILDAAPVGESLRA